MKVVIFSKNEAYCFEKMVCKNGNYMFPLLKDKIFSKRSFPVFQSEKVLIAKKVGKEYCLIPLINERYLRYTHRLLREQDISSPYHAPCFLAGGGFGNVFDHLSENFVVKHFITYTADIPADFLKEVAIYKLLENTLIVPKLLSFSVEKKKYEIQLQKGKFNGEFFMKSAGQLSIKKIIFKLATELNMLKNIGIMHRDIKPGNIIIMDGFSLEARLIDWGLASIGEKSLRSTLVQTRNYRAPEIVENLGSELQKYDAKIDVFSLGLAMFQLHDPDMQSFAETNEEHMQYIKTLCTPEMIRDKVSPSKASDLLVKMLDKNPATRYSFSDVISHEYFNGFNYPGPVPSLPSIKIDDIELVWESCVGHYRKSSFSWIFGTCDMLFTNYLTLASAFQLTDMFLYKLFLKKEKLLEADLHFIESACFTISAKIYEENFPNVLHAYMSTMDISSELYDKYKEKLEKAERTVIKRLDGNLLWKMPQKNSLANIFSMYSQKDVYN